MAKRLEYAILGQGRWARTMHGILAQHSRATLVGETRRRAEESEAGYEERISAALAATGAQAAWICVPPSANTLPLASAVADQGMHVVIEKPWIWDAGVADTLAAQARARGTVIGVHYEYCLLDAVEAWRLAFRDGAGLEFRGRFTTCGPDRLGIPAIQNLGSHLFAVRAYAVPQADVSTINCSYDGADARSVSLASNGIALAEIDFTVNREPIIQRYIARFEGAALGAVFPFDPGFAAKVWTALDAFQDSSERFRSRQNAGPT